MSIETTVGQRDVVMLQDRPFVEAISNCRSCGSSLHVYGARLGELSDQCVVEFTDKEGGRQIAPLQLILCHVCGLVQLVHTVNPDRLFKKMWYRSGINEQMKKMLHATVTKSAKYVIVERGDAVADIGSNDGTLLSFFNMKDEDKKRVVHTVGFEPCEELVQLAEAQGAAEVIFNTYFQRGNAVDRLLMKWHLSGFKIIFALAMFYDVDDPNTFLRDVHDLLHQDGLFVIQMNHVLGMLRNNTFDNVSHEHLCYYSLTSLHRLLSKHGFRILDVEQNDVNGGSIRVDIGIQGSNLRPPLGGLQRVDDMLKEELQLGVEDPETWQRFFERQRQISGALSNFIYKVTHEDKKTVYVYGASTRGTVLLQTLTPDARVHLLGAAERDPRKYGKYMAGTYTPIIQEDEARPRANYFLLLPYHFLPSILEREKQWLDAGGQFIVPLPTPRVISRDGERSLL